MIKLWRIAVIAIGLSTIPIWVFGILTNPRGGDFGFGVSFYGTAPSTIWKVNYVEKPSSASRAGMAAGDVIDFRNLDADTRVRLNFPQAGDSVETPFTHDGAARNATLFAASLGPFVWSTRETWLAIIAALNLGIGLVLAMRSWDHARGRIAATLLLLAAVPYAVGYVAPQGTHGLAALAAIAFTFGFSPFGVLPMFASVLLARSFVAARSRSLDALTVIAGAATLVSLTAWPVVVYRALAGEFGRIDDAVQAWSLWLMYLIAAISLLAAYPQSHERGRARFFWFVLALVPYQLALFLKNLPDATAIVWGEQLLQLRWPWWNDAMRFLEISLPLVMLYGIFVRRAIDIGFVINRVVVYGLLSLFLVAAFMVLEFLLGTLFVEVSRTTSLTIQLGIAVAIGFSSRYVHGYVDHFVDRIFFAKSHADEKALRRFAHETEAFSDEKTLLDRALETLEEHTEAGAIGIYQLEGSTARLVRASSDALPASIPIDDPALVSLRQWNEPLDTHVAKTALPDGLAFPMTHRGKAIGALFCGTKRDSTAFSPDQREPIVEFAHGLAGALLLLQETAESNGVVTRLDLLAIEVKRIEKALGID